MWLKVLRNSRQNSKLLNCVCPICNGYVPLAFLKQQVHVSGNELGQAGGEAMAAALRTNNTLETLEIGNVVLGAKVKLKSSGEKTALLPLKQLRENTVTELNLSNSGLGVDGGIMLAAVLEGNQSVQWVDVSQNSLGPEGGTALASALHTNTSIASVS